MTQNVNIAVQVHINPDWISCRDQAQAEYYDNQKADKGSKTRFRAERLQLYSILIHCCLGEIH